MNYIFRSFVSVLKYTLKKKSTINYPLEKNKRSVLFRGKHELDKSKCVLCKTCEKACIIGCIDIENAIIDYKKCCFCGFCVQSCPKNAITMKQLDVGSTFSNEELERSMLPGEKE